MRKPAINFYIDSASFLAFIFLISTGTLIYWILPAGSGNLSVWSLTRHEWGTIHFWIAVFFVSLIAVHFILHWSWIINMVKGKTKENKMPVARKMAIGLIVLIIVIVAIAPFFSPVSESGEISGRSHSAVELKK